MHVICIWYSRYHGTALSPGILVHVGWRYLRRYIVSSTPTSEVAHGTLPRGRGKRDGPTAMRTRILQWQTWGTNEDTRQHRRPACSLDCYLTRLLLYLLSAGIFYSRSRCRYLLQNEVSWCISTIVDEDAEIWLDRDKRCTQFNYLILILLFVHCMWQVSAT